jgi:hypothetical protein
MGGTCLVAGDVLPRGVEVVAVPVGDRDPREVSEDLEVLHAGQGPGAEVEQGVPLSECAVDELLLPGGPDRSVVSSNPTTLEAMSSVLISLTVPAATDAAFSRHERMNPADTCAPAMLDTRRSAKAFGIYQLGPRREAWSLLRPTLPGLTGPVPAGLEAQKEHDLPDSSQYGNSSHPRRRMRAVQ